jgi:phage recombination protein Bet
MTTTNTNTQVVKQERASALAVMANRFNVDPAKLLVTLKNTVFKGASDDECMALVIVANEYNLNPFRKEIYAFPAKGGGIVPVVGVDGWARMMNERPNFDGIEFEMEFDEKQLPVACTSIIHLKDRSKPVRITEYYDECQRNTDNWKNMPRRMLRHRALCQGVRVAFSVGGVMDEDEAEQMRERDPVAEAKPIQATVTESTPTKRAASSTERPAKSSQNKKDMVGAWMTEKQFTWAQIQPILNNEDVIAGADSIASFDEITEDQAVLIWGARTGIEAVLAMGGSK